jgi:surface protein
MITPYSNTIQVTTEKFPFEFTINTANTSLDSSAADQFRLPLVSSLPLNAVVDWGDGSSDTITVFNQPEVTHTYNTTTTTEFTISITGDLSGWQFNGSGDRLKMGEITSWESLTISVNNGFNGCANMTCTATDAPLITSTSLFGYFENCTNFNGAIGNWDVSNVESMTFMFRNNLSFNQNISPWITSSVGSMASMFSGAIAFNQNIGSWSTLNVERMENMFQNATAFNQDISDWNVSNVNNFTDFMTGKTPTDYSPENLDSIYNGWSSRPVQPNVSISFGTIIYTAAGQAGKDILTGATNNWTCVDGGVLRTETFEFTVKTDNAGVSTSTQFKLPLVNSLPLYAVVDWGDGSSDTITVFNQPEITHTYNTTTTTEFTISITGNLSGWQFGGGGDRLKMLNVSQWAGLTISINFGFWGCENMTCTATDAPLITSTSLFRYFENCTNFNGAIGNWDVSNVTSMTFMFSNNLSFNQDISPWITSSVESMASMFSGAILFNQNIGSWSTLNVTRMENMFSNATAFNQDISDWNVSNVANFTDFMVGKSAANYDAQYLSNIYEKWSLLTLVPNLNVNFGSIQYNTSGAIGKNRLLNAPNNWVLSDGGQEAPFEFTVKTDNAGVSTSTQFRMPLTTSTNLGFTVNWGDGSPLETITNHTLAIHTYATAGTYNVSVTGAILGWQFNNGGDKLKMLNVSQWAGLNISTTIGFRGCINLTATAIDAPLITSNSLEDYFLGCTNFNGAIGNWNISNVTNLRAIFAGARSFNQPINTWDTSKVTNMDYVFEDAPLFNQPLASWDTSNVTTMFAMFNNFRSLPFNFNQPINTWNTSKVTNMGAMFRNAYSFNQDIGNWNVSNVTDFSLFMVGKTAANFSAANLDSIYNGWSSLPSLQPNINISFGSIAYTSTSQAGKDILTNAPNNWVITDGSVAFQYTADVSVAGTSGVGFFQLPLVSDGNTINSIVDWGDGTTSAVTAFNDVDTLHDYNVTTGAAGLKTITISGLFSGWQFNDGGDKLKMRNVSSWGALKISVEAGFFGCANMTGTATDVPTITTTSLAYYFESTKFNGELNYWDVSGVSIFLRMFRLNLQFNQPLNLWDMSNATNLQTMLGVTNFNQNVNSWNVSKVTNFTNTFAYSNFNQPLDLWVLNTLEPINMTGMFENNPSFNRDISSWNTIAVTSMRYMFIGASAFNQNIGLWNVSNVTLMEFMFQSATAFNQDIGGWDISNVTNFTGFMANKTAANYSAANLSSIYDQWSTRPVKPNLSINFGTIDYFAASEPNKLILTSAPNLWTIIDGNPI